MLREEAIKYLKEMKDECNDTIHKVRYVTQEEALEMAIKALEQEPSGDLISRQEVNNLQKYRYYCGEKAITCVSLASINRLSSVNPQEPKTGHWIEDNQRDLRICSICGRALPLIPRKDYYCPNCGAKMVEPQESER